MSGYDLKQRIELSIGNFWTESYGQIYPALRKLENDGLVVDQFEDAKSLPAFSRRRTKGRDAFAYLSNMKTFMKPDAP